MIARHDGQVVLVLGGIPGERVRARVERVEKRLAFAAAVDVLDARRPIAREPVGDPLCGGCVYAHIAYARQLALKSEVIADAFVRIGRIPLGSPVAVAASPEIRLPDARAPARRRRPRRASTARARISCATPRATGSCCRSR